MSDRTGIEAWFDWPDVTKRAYLPLDCPMCGRLRLEYATNAEGNVVVIFCEKCGRLWPIDDDEAGNSYPADHTAYRHGGPRS